MGSTFKLLKMIGKGLAKSPIQTVKCLYQVSQDLKEERRQEEIRAEKKRQQEAAKAKRRRIARIKANPAEAIDYIISTLERDNSELQDRLDGLESGVKDVKESQDKTRRDLEDIKVVNGLGDYD